jgi:hypothetical protein
MRFCESLGILSLILFFNEVTSLNDAAWLAGGQWRPFSRTGSAPPLLNNKRNGQIKDDIWRSAAAIRQQLIKRIRMQMGFYKL